MSSNKITNRQSLVTVTRQNWALLFFVAIVPLQNIYISKIGSLGGGLNLLNLLLLFALLWSYRESRIVPNDENIKKNQLRPSVPIGFWVKSWVAWLILSVFVGILMLGHLTEGNVTMLKDQLVPLIMFSVTIYSIRHKKQMSYLLLAACVPLLYMFLLFYVQYKSVATWHYRDDLRIVNGTFSELGSNEIAAFYANYTLVALGVLLTSTSKKVRYLLYGVLLINGYCILFSHSRGGYLSFIAGALVMGVLVNWRRTLLIAAALFVFSAPLIKFMPVSVQERFGSIFVSEEKRDNSAESRFVLWDVAMKQFQRSPIIGIGFHSFVFLNPYAKDTHNYYVRVLTEQGLIGFTIIFIILCIAVVQSFKLARKATDPLARGLGYGMVGCVISVLVGNCFGDRFSHYPLISYFWIFIAIVILLNRGLVAGLQDGEDVRITRDIRT